MKKCPKCKIEMIIIQDDTPNPYSWGGFRLYGCQNCHMIYYQHLDREGKESQELTKEELERMQGKNKIPMKDLKRMLKKCDKKFEKSKTVWIKKPYYDPMRHHDSHLIN
jgi:hypothetical protein